MCCSCSWLPKSCQCCHTSNAKQTSQAKHKTDISKDVDSNKPSPSSPIMVRDPQNHGAHTNNTINVNAVIVGSPAVAAASAIATAARPRDSILNLPITVEQPTATPTQELISPPSTPNSLPITPAFSKQQVNPKPLFIPPQQLMTYLIPTSRSTATTSLNSPSGSGLAPSPNSNPNSNTGSPPCASPNFGLDSGIHHDSQHSSFPNRDSLILTGGQGIYSFMHNSRASTASLASDQSHPSQIHFQKPYSSNTSPQTLRKAASPTRPMRLPPIDWEPKNSPQSPKANLVSLRTPRGGTAVINVTAAAITSTAMVSATTNKQML